MFKKLAKLFSNPEPSFPTNCPKCKGQLYFPQVIEKHPLLGTYSPVIVMCENHVDGESFNIIGTKTCTYHVGNVKTVIAGRVVMPMNMKIEADDMIWFRPDLSEFYDVSIAQFYPQFIGKTVSEAQKLDIHPRLIVASRIYKAEA